MTGHRKFVTRALLGASALPILATGALTTPAFAQDDAVEEVIVTGSRIPRADLVANSPVAVVGAEEFTLTGQVTAERVLNTIPQIIPSFTNTSNNPGSGTATLNLRGLGTQRTLVMVNGRRFINGNQAGSVDVNLIPGALIERVDVVTGGASAVYGSDAMAGVVNFIMKDDFEGAQMQSNFDISHKGDGEQWGVSGLFGSNFADGRGNVTAFMEYFQRSSLLAGSRDFSSVQCDDGFSVPGTEGQFACGPGVPSDAPGAVLGLAQGGSTRIPGTRIAGAFDLDGDGENDASSIMFNPDGTIREWVSPNDRFNFAPTNFLQLPLERWSIWSSAHYDLTDNIRWYAEGNFANSQIARELAPTPFAESGFLITTDGNPFLPQESIDILNANRGNGDGTATVNISGRRFLEAGPRQDISDNNAFRIVTGLTGDALGGMTYDVSYLFARNSQDSFQAGNIVISRMQQALLVTTDANGNPVCTDQSNGCVAANIFGEGNVSPEAADFVSSDIIQLTDIETQVASASLAGDIADLPAGPLGVAVGAEWRSEASSFRPDFLGGSGDIDGFNAGEATIGGFEVYEIFTEALVPIVSEVEWADYIGLELGLRWSNYNNAVGTVWTYKAGGEWAINQDIRVRGLFQRAVRAPSVSELFLGNSNGFPGVNDPCNASDPDRDANLEAFCVSQGVPAGVIDTFEQGNPQVEATFGGNPDLLEETSNTWTVGTVIQPSTVPNLTLIVDFFNIEIEDAIATRAGGAQGVLDLCFLERQNEFCQFITRDVDGQIIDMDLRNANVAAFRVQGIDFQAQYQQDLQETFDLPGVIDWNLFGTYNTKNETTPSPLSGTTECAGFFDGQCGQVSPVPEWRITGRGTWRNGPYSVSLRGRYWSELKDINGGSPPVADGELFLDIAGTYEFSDSLRLSGGVDNILNNRPTAIGDADANANTLDNLYDVIGPRLFVGLTANF